MTKEEKKIYDAFYYKKNKKIRKKYSLEYYEKNKEARKKYSLKYYGKNKEKRKNYSVDYHERNKRKRNKQAIEKNLRQYGLTLKDYKNMHNNQEGKCKICQQKETRIDRYGKKNVLSVDHDHITSKVRGLLCSSCNLILGRIEKYNLLTIITKYLGGNNETL